MTKGAKQDLPVSTESKAGTEMATIISIQVSGPRPALRPSALARHLQDIRRAKINRNSDQ